MTPTKALWSEFFYACHQTQALRQRAFRQA
jgi:hypothetical protein